MIAQAEADLAAAAKIIGDLAFVETADGGVTGHLVHVEAELVRADDA